MLSSGSLGCSSGLLKSCQCRTVKADCLAAGVTIDVALDGTPANLPLPSASSQMASSSPPRSPISSSLYVVAAAVWRYRQKSGYASRFARQQPKPPNFLVCGW